MREKGEREREKERERGRREGEIKEIARKKSSHSIRGKTLYFLFFKATNHEIHMQA